MTTTHSGKTPRSRRWLLDTEDVFNMTGKHPEVIRRAFREGRLAGSNKSGQWITTRRDVADWLGVDIDDVRNLYSDRNNAEDVA